MDSGELIQVIQQEARPLVEGLYAELRSNLGTSHYHRLSNEELFRRGQAVYQHLAEWLASRDESQTLRSGEDLGKRRFAEGIPLGQVVLALILEEKHLWDYLNRSGSTADENLRRSVTEFFQKTIYSTARGYEESLAESNQRARRGIVPPRPAEKAAPKAEPAQGEPELEISRGGQVGELGG